MKFYGALLLGLVVGAALFIVLSQGVLADDQEWPCLVDGPCGEPEPQDNPQVEVMSQTNRMYLQKSCYSGGGVFGGDQTTCVGIGGVQGQAWAADIDTLAGDPSGSQDAVVELCFQRSQVWHDGSGYCIGARKSDGWEIHKNIDQLNGGGIRQELRYFIVHIIVNGDSTNAHWHVLQLTGYGRETSAAIDPSMSQVLAPNSSFDFEAIGRMADRLDISMEKVDGGEENYTITRGPLDYEYFADSFTYNGGSELGIGKVKVTPWGPDRNSRYGAGTPAEIRVQVCEGGNCPIPPNCNNDGVCDDDEDALCRNDNCGPTPTCNNNGVCDPGEVPPCDNCGGGGNTCTVSVLSNLATSWAIDGPDDQDYSGQGTSANYTSSPLGEYSLDPDDVDDIEGYNKEVSPTEGDCVAGGTLLFEIDYQDLGGGNVRNKCNDSGQCVVVNESGPDQCADDSGCAPGEVQLDCSPTEQTVQPSENASIAASGGKRPYSWSAPNGSPSSGGNSTTFQTSYSQAYLGTDQTVTLRDDDGDSISCKVKVRDEGGCPDPPCTPENQDPFGTLSGVNCETASGAAQDPDGSSPALVQIWKGAPGDQGSSALGEADASPDFSFGLPDLVRDGGLYDIFAFVQDQVSSLWYELTGSPQTIRCGDDGGLLACGPTVQTIAPNGTAVLSALNGLAPYVWTAPGGTPAAGTGASFSTGYAAVGTYNITLRDDVNETVTCKVNVEQGGDGGCTTPPCEPCETPPCGPICDNPPCDGGNLPPSCNFSASPSRIVRPSGSTLAWDCLNATSCSIDQGIGSVSATQGTKSVYPTETRTYTLSCTGPAGERSWPASIRVFTFQGGSLKEVRP